MHSSSTPHPTPLFRSLISPFTNPPVCSPVQYTGALLYLTVWTAHILGTSKEWEKWKRLILNWNQSFFNSCWQRIEIGLREEFRCQDCRQKNPSVSQPASLPPMSATTPPPPDRFHTFHISTEFLWNINCSFSISKWEIPWYKTLWFQIFLSVTRGNYP